MRGVAAVVVAAYHTSIIMALPKYGGQHAFLAATSKFWLGVVLFFVLSGFIIMFAHERDVGEPRRLGVYVWRRFSRVYPIYWLYVTAFIVAGYFGLGDFAFNTSPSNVMSIYTLVQFTPVVALPLKVAWTLFYEVGFYLLFALLVFNRKLGIASFALWLGAIVFEVVTFSGPHPGWPRSWSIEFLFGLVACLLFRRLPGRYGLPIVCGGVLSLGALLLSGRVLDQPGLQQGEPWTVLMLGIPFAMIVLGVTMMEKHRPFSPPAFLLMLGDASYSIYLVHSAAISLVCIVNRRLSFSLLGPDAMYFLTLAWAIAAGLAAYFLIEKPLLQRLSGLTNSRRVPLDALPDLR
ncbi:MAG: acyltransferase [Proteobacteria bacterium]|nr:acyltransferase [Pseudomonadota bacterium]